MNKRSNIVHYTVAEDAIEHGTMTILHIWAYNGVYTRAGSSYDDTLCGTKVWWAEVLSDPYTTFISREHEHWCETCLARWPMEQLARMEL